MSTDYGVYCLQCGDHLIIESLRSPWDAERLVMVSARLGLLREECPEIDLRIEIIGRWIDLSFFEIHKGHIPSQLVVIDEYGARWPRCEREEKNRNGQRIWCKREHNHKGKCSELGMLRGYR